MIDFLLQVLAFHAIELRDARKRINELETEKEKYYNRYIEYSEKYNKLLVHGTVTKNEQLR